MALALKTSGTFVTNISAKYKTLQKDEVHSAMPDDDVVVSVIVPVLHENGVAAALGAHLLHVSCGIPFELIIVCAENYCGENSGKPDTLSCNTKTESGAGCSGSFVSGAVCAGGRQGHGDVEFCAGKPQTANAVLTSSVRSIVISAPKGRARQMNAGAAAAKGAYLLFLHADTRLPQQAFTFMAEALERVKAGAFGLSIEDDGLYFRFVERIADVRNRLTRTPYGDQAQFFRTDFFHALNGYADIPIMEDVDIMRRIRRGGHAVEILKNRVATSARRWHKEGRLYCSVRNVCLRTLYALGVSPHSLSRWYRAHRG